MDNDVSVSPPDPSRALTQPHVFDVAAAAEAIRDYFEAGRAPARSDHDDENENSRRSEALQRALASR